MNTMGVTAWICPQCGKSVGMINAGAPDAMCGACELEKALNDRYVPVDAASPIQETPQVSSEFICPFLFSLDKTLARCVERRCPWYDHALDECDITALARRLGLLREN